MGVGETGVGEQVPIRTGPPPPLIVQFVNISKATACVVIGMVLHDIHNIIVPLMCLEYV